PRLNERLSLDAPGPGNHLCQPDHRVVAPGAPEIWISVQERGVAVPGAPGLEELLILRGIDGHQVLHGGRVTDRGPAGGGEHGRVVPKKSPQPSSASRATRRPGEGAASPGPSHS